MSTSGDFKWTNQILTPEQQSLVNLATPQYQQFANSNPSLPTGANAIAPFNPNQVAGQNTVLGTTGAQGQTVNTAAGTNNYLSGGAFLDPGNNQYVQNEVKAATDPIYENLQRRILPQIDANASTGAGGISANYGGSRQGVIQANALQDADRAAGQTAAGIENTALGQGLNATLGAIGQAPTTAASLTMPGVTQSTVGDVQQQQQQNVLNANNQAAWFQQMLPLLKAQALTQGAQGLPGGGAVSGGQGNQDPGLFQSILGGASAIGGLAGGLGKAASGLADAGGLSGLLGLLAI